MSSEFLGEHMIIYTFSEIRSCQGVSNQYNTYLQVSNCILLKYVNTRIGTQIHRKIHCIPHDRHKGWYTVGASIVNKIGKGSRLYTRKVILKVKIGTTDARYKFSPKTRYLGDVY